MRAFGVHALCVSTALTAQNTRGVRQVEPASPVMLRAQIEALLEDIPVRAVKIGMLPGLEHAQVLVELLSGLRLPIIYDTVFAPSGGSAFLDQDEARQTVRILGPMCELITPNLHEAEILCGFAIGAHEDVQRAARTISERFEVAQVLVKGGHAAGLDANTCCDWLWDGRTLVEFSAPRLDVPEARGTGCLLSSAIAAQRAREVELEGAIRDAKRWLGARIGEAAVIGAGRRVILDF